MTTEIPDPPGGQRNNPPFKVLPRSFYHPSAVAVAPSLLGHFLVRQTTDGFCGGPIVEAEAYLADDPACHAFSGRTARNRVMWGEPGRAYLYRIYGRHFCFNAVCRPEGKAEAVLVRAIAPVLGEATLRANRPVPKRTDLTSGPGKICAALRMDLSLDGADLCDPGSPVFIAANPDSIQYRDEQGPMITTTRVGLNRAADWPLRFYLNGSPYVSRRIRPAPSTSV